MKIKLFVFIIIPVAAFLSRNAIKSYAKEAPASQQKINALTAEILLEKASKAFEEKRIAKAIYLFQASIRYNPRYAQAYYRLGVVYAYEKKFDKAIVYLKEAVRFKPDFTKAYVNLGSAYGQLKNYKQALLYYRKALALEQNDPVIYHNIGSIYGAMGKQDSSEEYFRKAKELNPPAPE
jgi:tetratricopeptide (TPR) repeat protein